MVVVLEVPQGRSSSHFATVFQRKTERKRKIKSDDNGAEGGLKKEGCPGI
jgi:hypothetical protein